MKAFLIVVLIVFILSNPVTSQTVIDQRAKDGEKYLYLNFVVNAHDFTEPAQAYKTLMRAAHLFHSRGVKADFYFVEQLITNIVQFYPWFPDSLRMLGMGINLHHRAPHILSFKSSYINNLAKKPLDTLVQVLDSYEKYRLDLVTGGYHQAHSGGYQFVKESFGEAPFTVSTGESGPTSKMGRADVIACKRMGAGGILVFHEEGSDPDYPFFFSQGLLIRPVDFSVTRWTAGSQTEDEFWWEKIGTPDEYHYSPARYLEGKMGSINSTRLNFANAIIHETDFHYNLPPWRACYYSDSMSTVPYSAPFDTSRSAFWIRANPADHEERLWSYYDSLITYAASQPHIKTVIMKELNSMINPDLNRDFTADQVYVVANSIVSANAATFPPRFFNPAGDYLSVADAYYTLTRSLAEFFSTGSLPSVVSTMDINGPFDTIVVDISNLSQLDSLSIRKAVLYNDSLFTHYASTDPSVSRIPSSIVTGGFPGCNPLEYLYIIATAYKNIRETGSTGRVTPKSIQYTSKQIYQNPVKWGEKPARRISLTGIEDEVPPVPAGFEVSSAYPNPFNPSTSFKLDVSAPGVIEVTVFDIHGQLVKSEILNSGSGQAEYRFTGESLASGMYLFRFQYGKNIITRKSILIK